MTTRHRHRTHRSALVALALGVVAPLFAQPATAEVPAEAAPDESPVRPTIVLSGDDPELVEAVVAELRAAGFDVIVLAATASADGADEASEPRGTIVNIERVGDSVIVRATRAEGELDAELLASESDGMTNQEATALRTAEAIRSLVTTPSPKTRPPAGAPEVEDTPAPPAPAASMPPTPPPASPAAGSGRPPASPLGPDLDADAAWAPGDIRDLPVLRLAVFGGGGLSSPSPFALAGLGLRGQLTRSVSMAGLVMAGKSVGEYDDDSVHYDIWGVRAALLTSWEILGADNVWTPSIGGGVVGELQNWSGISALSVDDDVPPVASSTYMLPHYDGSLLGVGLAATAGISVGHPWRFRFDVMADVRMLTIALDGAPPDDVAPTLAPTVMGMVGLEYDLVTRPILRHTASRRAP